jgi:cyclohexanecarboxylate-CoA ligase
MGAPAFLYDLTAEVEQTDQPPESLSLFVAAGAPVARRVLERAEKTLDLRVVRGWGMTEVGAVSVSAPDDDPERVASTDGRALPGVDLEIFDPSGTQLPRGTEGLLKVRSPSMFGGYLGRPELRNLDAAGWFDTGDIGVVDPDGFLRITGRAKDLIIRGGENIPVVEIEGLIRAHPGVRDIAIVGAPDERLGERACAFVVPAAGHAMTLEGLAAYLTDCNVARQYLPEYLEVLDALPSTPTGKVQRFALRERAARLPRLRVRTGGGR